MCIWNILVTFGNFNLIMALTINEGTLASKCWMNNLYMVLDPKTIKHQKVQNRNIGDQQDKITPTFYDSYIYFHLIFLIDWTENPPQFCLFIPFCLTEKVKNSQILQWIHIILKNQYWTMNSNKNMYSQHVAEIRSHITLPAQDIKHKNILCIYYPWCRWISNQWNCAEMWSLIHVSMRGQNTM